MVKFPQYRIKIIASLLLTIGVVAGCFVVNNYIANRWIYPFEASIRKEYDFVENIRFSTPDSTSAHIDCYFKYEYSPDDYLEKTEKVFEKIKTYVTSEEGMKQMEKARRSGDSLELICIIIHINKITHNETRYISENPPNFTEWKRSLQDGPWDD